MNEVNTIKATNDFVIRFANVNGSGSASANNLFSKAVFRLGVPVSSKNIFPSNIQGLPTWFEVRINEQGYLGRRGGYDFIVAVNGQTMLKDYHDLLPGGYFFYDSSKRLPDTFTRDDVIEIGIPLTAICNANYTEPRLRQIFKNIIYVGALAYLFDMDFTVFEDSIKSQFAKKEKLIAPNIQALRLGYDYAQQHFSNSCGLNIHRRDLNGEQILLEGNAAAGLGAVYAGATVAGWYPITPSTSVVEAFEKYCHAYRVDAESGKNKFAIVQAEDELAAIGIVIGASWNGARAFTATSGPGVSLMSEFLGLAYFSEIPVMLMDIQRTGPSTGMPTRTQQSDILSAAYASHGDTKNVLLFPANPKECFELTVAGFDLAERLQTPVILMSDLDLGMNVHQCDPITWDDDQVYDRGKVLNEKQLDEMAEKWGRYLDVDGDGVPYRTIPGTHPVKGAYFTRGSSHDEYAAYTEDGEVYARGMQRLLVKWNTAKKLVPKAQIDGEGKSIGVIYYGTSDYATQEAMDILRVDQDIDSMRIKAFPFGAEVAKFVRKHDVIFVIEQNRDAQMKTLLVNELAVSPNKFVEVLNIDGMPITAAFLVGEIRHRLEQSTTSIKQQEA
ncbi:2-oxoacid:acceptor oxidoreductase subunit alpha [Marinicella sp. S1101]|uniref:2-oxoacid:acceptor oxidoreductase subunit alpha n=1 Tax=Marinicella marina TaxID=2996016 RepID=UPI002260A376|nr:2-oxoacid:acceptor oxidoreductase subunit alpha [Marinicella marina]MCX7554452.1 2-oxoacid:acceptor oxidoreductase subunit alpha [Marinicella marina]MDJ1140603.1 2-oxoacid:acceptor oxidoreductase subunit alpha [Marinicella marina]